VAEGPLSESIERLRRNLVRRGVVFPNDGMVIDPYAEFDPPDGGPPCATCRGTRWTRYDSKDMARDDPRLGSIVRCQACAPYFDQQRMDRLTGSLPKAFQAWTLETFPRDANGTDIVAMLMQWVEDPAEPWLYMYSNARLDERSGRMVYASGRGKTGLAVGLFKYLGKKGKVVAFVYVPDMIQRLKDGFKNPDDAFGSELMKAAREADVLVLDDLGAGRPSEWANKDVMMPLISSRHANGMRTIITTNLSPTELVDYFEHDRAVTRMEERCESDTGFWVLDMTDMTDLRLNKTRKIQEEPAF
jgi:hypothetical protein